MSLELSKILIEVEGSGDITLVEGVTNVSGATARALVIET